MLEYEADGVVCALMRQNNFIFCLFRGSGFRVFGPLDSDVFYLGLRFIGPWDTEC